MTLSRTIEFVIFPGALGLDITGPLEVFSTASALAGKKNAGYTFRFVSANKGPVRLSSGLEIVADTDFENMLPADSLLVPGRADINSIIDDLAYMDYICKRAGEVKRIISVCKGSFILAAAGLLDGKKATTHWMAADKLAKIHPNVKVQPDAIFTRDGNIYTSAGVTAGIDLALAVVEEDLGLSVAIMVSRILVMYFRRPGSQSQFSAPLKAQEAAGEDFAKLHKWLVGNLEKPISVEDMAEYLIMSDRNFARVFKAKTGMTPNKYLETLRLDRAREIMAVGDESLETIAKVCGFGREERLRRAFLRRFKVTPSQYRLHFMKA
ncbi:MAG: helix-turn-helix domain-containing protein [bacterium]|nr:helix-turn-helix domain-containing protein [bacterium]